MDDLILKARKTLEKAEKNLQALLSDAMENRRYDTVAKLARWAGDVAELLNNGAPIEEAPPRASLSEETAAYPRFFRDGDELLKVGWSKKNEEEYEHRAPRQVILSLIAALHRAKALQQPVKVKMIDPVRNQQNEEIPQYQIYLALAHLKEQGVVKSHGRDGYTLQLDGQAPETVADNVWKELPERSS